MRVKLCARCPYTPQDLASHYDPEAALHACAKCDRKQNMIARHYPREAYRRQRCSVVTNITRTTQRTAARSVAENSASSGITRAGPPSVQPSAWIASGRVGTLTVDGCSDLESPNEVYGEQRTAIPLNAISSSKEIAS